MYIAQENLVVNVIAKGVVLSVHYLKAEYFSFKSRCDVLTCKDIETFKSGLICSVTVTIT